MPVVVVMCVVQTKHSAIVNMTNRVVDAPDSSQGETRIQSSPPLRSGTRGIAPLEAHKLLKRRENRADRTTKIMGGCTVGTGVHAREFIALGRDERATECVTVATGGIRRQPIIRIVEKDRPLSATPFGISNSL